MLLESLAEVWIKYCKRNYFICKEIVSNYTQRQISKQKVIHVNKRLPNHDVVLSFIYGNAT